MQDKSSSFIVQWPPVGQLPESPEVSQARIAREMPDQAIALGLQAEFGPSVVWHGTATEARELQAAIARECAESDQPCADDWINADCPAHAMLDDQALLDRLVMVRRMVTRRVAGEGVGNAANVRGAKHGRPRQRLQSE